MAGKCDMFEAGSKQYKACLLKESVSANKKAAGKKLAAGGPKQSRRPSTSGESVEQWQSRVDQKYVNQNPLSRRGDDDVSLRGEDVMKYSEYDESDPRSGDKRWRGDTGYQVGPKRKGKKKYPGLTY